MAADDPHDLEATIAALDRQGLLARVAAAVDPRHELAGIAGAIAGRRAVLFEHVAGKRWPVLAGLYRGRALVGTVLDRAEADLPRFIADALRASAPGAVTAADAPARAVTESAVDLALLPAPTHALDDAAPALDGAVFILRDPLSGVRAIGLVPAAIAGAETLTIDVSPGSTIAAALAGARSLDRSLWLTLNGGAGAALPMAAIAAGYPLAADPLGVAGALAGATFRLAEGMESDVEIAANAMWALECEAIPAAPAAAGPEAGGFVQTLQVRRVHRRARPVFHAISSAFELPWLRALVAEAVLIALLPQQIAGIAAVRCGPAGGALHAVVALTPDAAARARQTIIAAFAAVPDLNRITIVDDDIDPDCAEAVAWAMAARFDPRRDAMVVDLGAAGGRIGYDATRPSGAGAPGLRARPPRHRMLAAADYGLDLPAAASAIVHPATPQGIAIVPAPSAGLQASAPPPARSATTIAAASVDVGASASPAAPPAATADWNETRWLERELESMRKTAPSIPEARTATRAPVAERNDAAPPIVPAAPVPPPQTPAASARDWDENRWWRDAMEEMKREAPATQKPPASPPAATGRPSAPTQAPNAPAEDEDGSFFRDAGPA